MERMIIKHTSGSKANQVEEFPLNHYSELVLGRDTSATVKYDPDRDDLVGREHAKISRDANDETAFVIEDTGSRNGTFINGKKVVGSHPLRPGDSVQLGAGGPEFTFDLEPRPANATKPTRISEVSAGGKAVPMTRVADADAGSVVTAPAAKTSVGKATVERMISGTVAETKKQEGKKYAAIGGVAAVVILLLFGIVVGGGYWYSSRQQAALKSELDTKSGEMEQQAANIKSKMDEDKANGGLSAAEISDQFGKAVVYIQGSWQLINKESKSPIYHRFFPNSLQALGAFYGKNFGKGPIIQGGGDAIPVYFKTENGYEPMLTDQRDDLSYPMGGSGYTCSGFIVTTDGFILTNRHCSSPWKSQYSFPQDYPKGIVLNQDFSIVGAGLDPPTDWIPDNTKAVPRQYQGQFDGTQKLSIMLPGSDNPIEAQKVQDSPRHDVGMLKVSVPGNLPKVELYDSWDTLKKGEGLVIMGYPGSAPSVYAPIKSQNFLNQENKFTVIPDPTVSVTSVGNIVKNSDPNDQAHVRISETGDTIRYAGSLTYGGNSGGPVFDMQGRVIGIHFAGAGVQAGNLVGFAVPIRYGLQLFPGNQ